MAGVEFPDNDFTRMIEATASGNRSGVRSAGVASATPVPTAQSANLGRVVEEEKPLSPEERAELDRLAVEAGVRDPRLGTPDTEASYPSLEAAIAAGTPVNRPPVREPAQTAREFVGARTRLPDFRRVEGIDLQRGCVMLDGMEFPISDEDAMDFKQFVVETARAAILSKLEEAVGLFTLPDSAEATNGGSTEGTGTKVQQQHAGSSPEPPV